MVHESLLPPGENESEDSHIARTKRHDAHLQVGVGVAAAVGAAGAGPDSRPRPRAVEERNDRSVPRTLGDLVSRASRAAGLFRVHAQLADDERRCRESVVGGSPTSAERRGGTETSGGGARDGAASASDEREWWRARAAVRAQQNRTRAESTTARRARSARGDDPLLPRRARKLGRERRRGAARGAEGEAPRRH